jgi:hypothetical protein
MSFWMIDDLVDARIRDIRRQAGKPRTGMHRAGPRPAGGAGRWPRLRSRVGFMLVEAGLHVLATTEPAPRDRPETLRGRQAPHQPRAAP